MEYHQFSAPMDEQPENWPIDLKLFHPIPEYLFLHEKANCISVEAILKMCGLSFEIEYRPNAEYMSPTGDVPFIKTGNTLISGIEAIIDFAKSYDKSFTKRSEEIERDTRVYMNHFHQVLTDAELYFIWCHEKVVQEYTYPRYVSKYPWPLSSILYYSKKRNITKRIKSGSEPITNYDEAIRRVECELENLSKLMVGPYFFGDSPTEFDALIFGHLTAIQTTALPDDALSIITRENEAIYNLCGLIGARYFPGLLLTKET